MADIDKAHHLACAELLFLRQRALKGALNYGRAILACTPNPAHQLNCSSQQCYGRNAEA